MANSIPLSQQSYDARKQWQAERASMTIEEVKQELTTERLVRERQLLAKMLRRQ